MEENLNLKTNDNFSEEPVCVVNYNVTASENENAYNEFQNRFRKKKRIISTCVFSAVFLVFLLQEIIFEGSNINWIGMVVTAAAVFITWYNPVMVRKTLVQALEAIKDDRYIFTLYKWGFTIETIIPEDEFEDGEERVSPPPRRVKFSDGNFSCCENEELFVIFIGRETIYALPKRCMSDNDKEIIRKIMISDASDLKRKE